MDARAGENRRDNASAMSFSSPQMWMPCIDTQRGAKWSASSIAILLTISDLADKVTTPYMTPKASPIKITRPRVSLLTHRVAASKNVYASKVPWWLGSPTRTLSICS